MVDELAPSSMPTRTTGKNRSRSALNHSLWQLLRFPDQLALLRAEPRLTDSFIEESLRFESPVQGLMRRTTRDVELHGVTIPANSMVTPRYGAANRDERKFPEPPSLFFQPMKELRIQFRGR